MKIISSLVFTVSMACSGVVLSAPQINSAGLGCDNNQCIWISGTGFTEPGGGCSVSIFAGDWSHGTTPEAVLYSGAPNGPNCTNTLVTFAIPSNVLQSFVDVNVNVTNTSLTGVNWSNPVHIVISPMGTLQFNGETMSDYYTLGQRRGGLIISSDSSQAKKSEWATNPISATRTDITWGDPNNWPAKAGDPTTVEEWEVKSNCRGGKNFIWLNAYRNDYAGTTKSYRFPIVTTRAEIQVGNGPWSDITAGGSCGTNGQPYMLNSVTTDSYSLRVWGNILNKDGVTVGTQFFWQERVSYVSAATNSCWQSDSVSTRPAIKQEEAWWDTKNPGWSIGSGTISNGIPDGNQVTYGRWQYVGQHAGAGWLESDAAGNACLQFQWPW
jgi:hypothetical protein